MLDRRGVLVGLGAVPVLSLSACSKAPDLTADDFQIAKPSAELVAERVAALSRQPAPDAVVVQTIEEAQRELPSMGERTLWIRDKVEFPPRKRPNHEGPTPELWDVMAAALELPFLMEHSRNQLQWHLTGTDLSPLIGTVVPAASRCRFDAFGPDSQDVGTVALYAGDRLDAGDGAAERSGFGYSGQLDGRRNGATFYGPIRDAGSTMDTFLKLNQTMLFGGGSISSDPDSIQVRLSSVGIQDPDAVVEALTTIPRGGHDADVYVDAIYDQTEFLGTKGHLVSVRATLSDPGTFRINYLSNFPATKGSRRQRAAADELSLALKAAMEAR